MSKFPEVPEQIQIQRRILAALGLENEKVFSIEIRLAVGEAAIVKIGKYATTDDLSNCAQEFQTYKLMPKETGVKQ